MIQHHWIARGSCYVLARLLALAAVLWTMLSTSPATAADINDFINYSLFSPSGTLQLRGRLYVPPEAAADPTTPRPFILFLHGAGEKGTNNTSQINSSIDNLIAEAKQRGAFLYAPQTSTDWIFSGVTTQVNTMITRAIDTLNADPQRVYVTGLSMGGGGVWDMLSRYPDRFAAGVPLAGVTPGADFNPANLVDQSIWAFHARNDGTVNVQTTRTRIHDILGAAHEQSPIFPSLADTTTFNYFDPTLDLRYTETPTGGHGIWPAVYSSEPMYDWMFSHTLAVPEPSSVVGLSIAGVLLGLYRWRSRRGITEREPLEGVK